MVSRAREQAGFGMIELLLAMVILNIALLALLSAFTSGTIALTRASRVSTAGALANSQLEQYRAMTYSSIALNTTAVASADATYKSEPGSDAQVTSGSCGVGRPECNPSRTATGADSRSYRIDTYVMWQTPTSGRPVKRVTVVIRDPANLAGQALVRQASTFDESTG